MAGGVIFGGVVGNERFRTALEIAPNEMPRSARNDKLPCAIRGASYTRQQESDCPRAATSLMMDENRADVAPNLKMSGACKKGSTESLREVFDLGKQRLKNGHLPSLRFL